MNRVPKYTLLCFLIAAVFVLGSMAGMNLILQKKENRLLQERGIREMESPVVVWQEPQAVETKDQDESSGSRPPQLTVEQVEEVIDYKGDAVDEILHDPVPGQISMEEAITCGEQWLVDMGFLEEEMVSAVGESNSYTLSRRASLAIRKDRGVSKVPVEPYYSFWTVRFSNEAVYAVLSINAVTGRVWDAEITLYDDMTRQFPWETLNLFTELAGVQADTEHYLEMNDTNTGATLAIGDSRLRAQVKYYDIEVVTADREGQREGGYRDAYSIVSDNEEITEYYGGRETRRQRIIEYHLVLSVSFQTSS